MTLPIWQDGQVVHASDINAIERVIGTPNKLVSIGDNGFGTAVSVGTTSTVGTSEMMFTVGVAVTRVSAVWDNWFTNGTGGVDTDPTGSVSFNASLRVVSSTAPGTTTNTIYRFNFGGRTTATLDPGGRVVADELALSLLPGDIVAVRTYLASGTGYAPRSTWGSLAPGWGGFTAASDLTAPGSAAIASSTGTYYGPAALLGRQVGANVKSVLLAGDSVAIAIGDAAYRTNGALGNGGFVIRALSGQAGLLNIGLSGDAGSNFLTTNGSFRRLSNALFANTAIVEYGAADLIDDSAPLATVQQTQLNIAANLRQMAISKVFFTTLVPRTTSTDGWATTTNQTVSSAETNRVAYNTWLRAGSPVNATTLAPVAVGTSGALLAGSFGHPFTGYIDTTSAVESGLNSGFWKPCQRVVTDGAITTGTAILASNTANFQAAIQESGGDKGTGVTVIGAGASGGLLATYVATYSSATQVVLANNAGTTVSGAQVNIGVYTLDGFHPSSHGHFQMAPTVVAQL